MATNRWLGKRSGLAIWKTLERIEMSAIDENKVCEYTICACHAFVFPQCKRPQPAFLLKSIDGKQKLWPWSICNEEGGTGGYFAPSGNLKREVRRKRLNNHAKRANHGGGENLLKARPAYSGGAGGF